MYICLVSYSYIYMKTPAFERNIPQDIPKYEYESGFLSFVLVGKQGLGYGTHRGCYSVLHTENNNTSYQPMFQVLVDGGR